MRGLATCPVGACRWCLERWARVGLLAFGQSNRQRRPLHATIPGMKFITLSDAAATGALRTGASVRLADAAGDVGTVATSLSLRVILKDETTPERRAAAARRLLEMARAKPMVKTAAKGITAELRRRRNRGEIG